MGLVRIPGALAALSGILLLPAIAPAALRGQSDTVTLAPVVVTATRVAQPLDAVVAAVTVITAADLEARGIRTVGEALRDVPGAAVVETGSYGGQSALFLRGGEADYVKVLLDGIPLNQPGGAIDFADLTTDNVERIEVVRGPGSVLYGSDAVTGVVQIFTRRGVGSPRATVEGRGGTYGTAEAAVGMAGGGAHAGYAFRVARFTSNGLYRLNNDYRNTTASGRVHVAVGPRTTASVAYNWGDATYHFPTDGTGQPVDANQWSAERGPGASLDVSQRMGEALELRLQGRWRESRVRFSDQADSPDDDGSFESRDLMRRAGAGLALHWRPRLDVVLSGGMDYEDQRQHGRSEFAASFGTFPDSTNVRRWDVGYYGQALLGSAGPLSGTVGVRLDRNAQFGAYGTVRGGVSYHLDGRTRLRAAAGTGFKEPTFFENFAQGFVRGNPGLEPERSRSWEVGLEHTVPGGRVAFSVTYFDQRFRDLIEYTAAPAPPDSVNYFNVAGARAAGVEARLTARLAADVVVTVTYDYLDTRVIEGGPDGGPDGLFVAGRPLIRRPGHSITPELAVPLGGRGLVTVGVRWVGSRDDLDFARAPGERRVTLRPYARVNVAAHYDLGVSGPAGSPLALTARIENLTGDDAWEVAGFRPRGRTVLVGARLHFGP